jgi:hypothetical protein
VIVVGADAAFTERGAAHGAGVALGRQHLVELLLGDAEPDELVCPVPARNDLGVVRGPPAYPPAGLARPLLGQRSGRAALATVAGPSAAEGLLARHPLAAQRS